MVVRYGIDGTDTIVETGGDWDAFAVENGGLVPVIGRPLWDFVAGDDVRAAWSLLLRRARTAQSPVAFEYRCDAPGIRRRMKMELQASKGDGILFRSTLIEAAARPVFSGRWHTGEADTLVVCGWCGRAYDRVWLEPEAVLDMRRAELPRLSHGICDDCAAALRAA